MVKATSATHRTPIHDAERWLCDLDWMVDGEVRDTTTALVVYGALIGPRRCDMRNSGLHRWRHRFENFDFAAFRPLEVRMVLEQGLRRFHVLRLQNRVSDDTLVAWRTSRLVYFLFATQLRSHVNETIPCSKR